MNYIIGNGISAYVIAACLDYLGEDFIIVSKDNNHKIPPLMHLRHDYGIKLCLYQKLFKLDTLNGFLGRCKVGYLYKKTIKDTLTPEMIKAYVSKQGRANESSSMNDKNNNYPYIDLSKIFPLLIERYKDKVDIYEPTNDEINNMLWLGNKVYDTVGGFLQNIEKHEYKFYLTINKNQIYDYDYVYDCNPESIVKRYTQNSTEYIQKPIFDDCIELTNYYDPFKVYEHRNYVAIGRYATGTQTKQEDIIKYMLGDKNEI